MALQDIECGQVLSVMRPYVHVLQPQIERELTHCHHCCVPMFPSAKEHEIPMLESIIKYGGEKVKGKLSYLIVIIL